MASVKSYREITIMLLERTNPIGFIKYINSITDAEQNADEAAAPEQDGPVKFTDASKKWMETNWPKYVELLRSYVYWNSEDVSKTKEQCRLLSEFIKDNPDLAKQITALETFIAVDDTNDEYNWDMVENQIAAILDIMSSNDPRQINQRVFEKGNNSGQDFYARVNGLCSCLKHLHHTVRPKNSPLYNKEEVTNAEGICDWYLNDQYWTKLSYESLIDFHELNKPIIARLDAIRTTALEMLNAYPIGTYPVRDLIANTDKDAIVIGYSIEQIKSGVEFRLKCLNRDGSVYFLKYLSGKHDDSAETGLSDDTPANIAEPDAEPEDAEEEEQSGDFGSWASFNSGTLI